MPVCVKLEWASAPHFTPCAVGEPADFSGLKVHAIYDDGARDTIAVTWKMFNESDLQVAGAERKSMITYGGQRLPVMIPLRDCYLERIEAAKKTGFICREGEYLDTDRICVCAFYSDGSSQEIHHYKYYPYRPFTLDTKEISIRYGRSRTVLSLSVVPKEDEKWEERVGADAHPEQDPLRQPTPTPIEITSSVPEMCKTVQAVSVAKIPTRQKYLVGDLTADLAGGRLDIIYSDGTVGQIDMAPDGEVVLDASNPGRGLVSFTCVGMPVTFPVEVLTPKIKKLTIKKLPAKLHYIEGELLDLTGLILEATYNDLSQREVRGLQSNDFVVTMSHDQDGVTLAYNGSPFTIQIEVERRRAPVIPVGVDFAELPHKTVYGEGEALYPDLTGAKLMVQMSDGRRDIIDVTQNMVTSFDVSHEGKSVLAIIYQGFTAKCAIEVRSKKLCGLELAPGPKKRSYIEGEPIDISGAVLYGCYDNGQKVVLTNYSMEPEVADCHVSAIVFRYEGFTATWTIDVEPLKIVALDWASVPKHTYFTHEPEIFCAGGLIRARKNDGSFEDIPLTPDMVQGFSTAVAGTTVATVVCHGMKIPLPITVQDRTLLGLQVSRQPRVQYREGETFDTSELVVEALFTGGSKEQVPVNYIPVGPLTTGVTSVMLIYKDKAVVVPITVHQTIDANPEPVLHDQEEVKASLEGIPIPPETEITSIATETGEEVRVADSEEHEGPTGKDGPTTVAAAQVTRAPVPEQRTVIPAFYPSSFQLRFDQ